MSGNISRDEFNNIFAKLTTISSEAADEKESKLLEELNEKGLDAVDGVVKFLEANQQFLTLNDLPVLTKLAIRFGASKQTEQFTTLQMKIINQAQKIFSNATTQENQRIEVEKKYESATNVNQKNNPLLSEVETLKSQVDELRFLANKWRLESESSSDRAHKALEELELTQRKDAAELSQLRYQLEQSEKEKKLHKGVAPKETQEVKNMKLKCKQLELQNERDQKQINSLKSMLASGPLMAHQARLETTLHQASATQREKEKVMQKKLDDIETLLRKTRSLAESLVQKKADSKEQKEAQAQLQQLVAQNATSEDEVKELQDQFLSLEAEVKGLLEPVKGSFTVKEPFKVEIICSGKKGFIVPSDQVEKIPLFAAIAKTHVGVDQRKTAAKKLEKKMREEIDARYKPELIAAGDERDLEKAEQLVADIETSYEGELKEIETVMAEYPLFEIDLDMLLLKPISPSTLSLYLSCVDNSKNLDRILMPDTALELYHLAVFLDAETDPPGSILKDIENRIKILIKGKEQQYVEKLLFNPSLPPTNGLIKFACSYAGEHFSEMFKEKNSINELNHDYLVALLDVADKNFDIEDEYALFEVVHKWVKAQAAQQQRHPRDIWHAKSIGGKALYEVIHFEHFSPKEILFVMNNLQIMPRDKALPWIRFAEGCKGDNSVDFDKNHPVPQKREMRQLEFKFKVISNTIEMEINKNLFKKILSDQITHRMRKHVVFQGKEYLLQFNKQTSDGHRGIFLIRVGVGVGERFSLNMSLNNQVSLSSANPNVGGSQGIIKDDKDKPAYAGVTYELGELQTALHADGPVSLNITIIPHL